MAESFSKEAQKRREEEVKRRMEEITTNPWREGPRDQIAFVEAVLAARARYKAASNELQKTSIRGDRMQELRRLLSSRRANLWIGALEKLGTEGGKAWIKVKISPDIWIKTTSAPFGSMETMIDPGTSLYAKLARMSEWDLVVFSGSFFPSDKDWIEEVRATEEGGMLWPEFLFKFSDVSLWEPR